MALDYGAKRIGVAISDEMRVVAKPLQVIEASGRLKSFHALRQLIIEHDVSSLLIGLPTGGQGEVGLQARTVIDWSLRLAPEVAIPIILWDESYSSVKAASVRRHRKRQGQRFDDAVAAAFFLQDYLEALATSKDEPGKTLESYT